MIRVLLADDHALVRAGLREIVNDTADLRVVAEASDGEEAIAQIRLHQPDVAVLDVRMPRLGGVEVLERLAAERAAPPALLLTTFDDSEALARGLRAGARGFLTKHVTAEQLIAALHAVAAGGSYFTAMEGLPTPTPAQKEAAPPTEALTSRELQVLQLMSRGLSNREIAVALGIAEGTAKNLGSSLFSKLGVHDRTRAVLRGIQLQLIR